MVVCGVLTLLAYVVCITCICSLLIVRTKKTRKYLFLLSLFFAASALLLYIIGYATIYDKWNIGWEKGDCDFDSDDNAPYGPAGIIGLVSILLAIINLLIQFC